MSEGTNIASERVCDRARTHKNWNQMHDLKSSNNGLENTLCVSSLNYIMQKITFIMIFDLGWSNIYSFYNKKITKWPQLEPIAPTLVLTPPDFLIFSACSIRCRWKISWKAKSNIPQDMNTSNVHAQGNNNSQKSVCARNKWTNNHEHPLYDTPMIYSVSKQPHDITFWFYMDSLHALSLFLPRFRGKF